MANNLDFDVTAKTQAARDELQLLNAQIRATTSEVKKLATEANKDPLALPKFRAANAELTKLKQTAADLGKTVHHSKEEVEGFGDSLLHLAHGNRGVARLFKEFGNLNGSIENTSVIFGRLVGGFAGGLAAMAAFKGFEFIKDQIDEVSKALGELKKTAGEIGIKPIQLQAAQEVVTGVGEEADVATRALKGLNEQIEEGRKKSPDLPFWGAKTPDFSKPEEILGTDRMTFPQTEEGDAQHRLADLKAFVNTAKTMDATSLNILSKNLFQGVPAESMLKVAPALIKDLEAEIERLQTTQRGATEKNLADDARLRISKDKLSKAYKEFSASVANTMAPAQAAFNEFLSSRIDLWAAQFPKDVAQIEGWAAAIAEFFQNLSTAVDTTVAQIEGAWTSLWGSLTSVAQTAVDTIKSIFDAIGQGASAAWAAITGGGGADAGGGGDIVPAGARGGYVRGPGTGTSDSILARLSAGEFVLNSASVRRLGTSFLHGLNGFAEGGLVGASPLRFAAGGLVPSASGGRPVHLHLGSQSFALSGAGHVVEALVSEAHWQQTRSAGVKPSWFGGRPGG